jgi:hypothetical protein
MNRRPFRLVIEVNNPDSPAAITTVAPTPPPEPVAAIQSESAPAPSIDLVWPLLVDARKKIATAMTDDSEVKVNELNQWLGGALAAAAVLTGNSGEALRDRLAAEVPLPEIKNPYENMGEFRHVERTRPKPHPGAQRPIDPSELTPEEREELGIILPGEANKEPPVGG